MLFFQHQIQEGVSSVRYAYHSKNHLSELLGYNSHVTIDSQNGTQSDLNSSCVSLCCHNLKLGS